METTSRFKDPRKLVMSHTIKENYITHYQRELPNYNGYLRTR